MYKYFAFISFQSSDAREAVRLQHAIERYRLPAVLCKDGRVPRRIKPLFCYLNDMHSGEELMQELKQRMEQSHYLIVVCSPNAAKSAYVNSGIDYFVSLGRRDSIIPIIIDGVPYSGDPATECFPEALRRHFPKHADPLQDHSILGINIHEHGFGSSRATYNRAMLMVVARILDLDFDGLLLRDKQRQRRRIAGWCTAALLAGCALTGVWRWAQPVTVQAVLTEQTPHNDCLPSMRDAVVCMQIGDELKRDTLHHLTDTLCFNHVPRHYVGKEVAVSVACEDYLPLDTVIRLQTLNTLPVSRDADKYGFVHVYVRPAEKAAGKTVTVAGREVTAGEDGYVELRLPVNEQQTRYPVQVAGLTDTVYMPCGERDVILVE